MSTSIEHTDPYRQRYVTTTQTVTGGLQVTTEIYTPYLYGESVQTRQINNEDGSRSLEVWGLVTTIIQTLTGTGLNVRVVAEGQAFEEAWIEVWRSCLVAPDSRFAYLMDCQLVGTADSEVTAGPAFVSLASENPVVWADVAADGEIVPLGTGTDGQTALEFIDVWS